MPDLRYLDGYKIHLGLMKFHVYNMVVTNIQPDNGFYDIIIQQ